MMMRVLAFVSLVGAVKGGLTELGGACGIAGSSDSDLCKIKFIARKVAEEAAGAGGTCGDVACPCWGCMDHDEPVFETMTTDNPGSDSAEADVAAALTVMTTETFGACAEPCGLGGSNGPVQITEAGYEMPETGPLAADANWCGEWTKRQTTETCKTSIFDAKGVLFVTIIGGALAIIFFQCSIAAVVALMNRGDGSDDAKP